MHIEPIHNDEDHARALKEIGRLWGAALGTPDGDKLNTLVLLVEQYEEKHYPVEPADPVQILHYAIDEMGRSRAELGRLIGPTRASEVLARKRRLTLDMIRKISAAWRLPIETLIGHYELAPAGAKAHASEPA